MSEYYKEFSPEDFENEPLTESLKFKDLTHLTTKEDQATMEDEVSDMAKMCAELLDPDACPLKPFKQKESTNMKDPNDLAPVSTALTKFMDAVSNLSNESESLQQLIEEELDNPTIGDTYRTLLRALREASGGVEITLGHLDGEVRDVEELRTALGTPFMPPRNFTHLNSHTAEQLIVVAKGASRTKFPSMADISDLGSSYTAAEMTNISKHRAEAARLDKAAEAKLTQQERE